MSGIWHTVREGKEIDYVYKNVTECIGGGTPQLKWIDEGTTPVTQKMKNGYIDCQPNGSPMYCYARGYLIDGELTVPYQQNATMTYDKATEMLTVNRHYSTGVRLFVVN